MNVETCFNYFEFLSSECDRYLKNGTIEEEEIHQLKIEFDRFITKVNGSDLPLLLKNRISDLNLDYTFNSNRDYFEMLGRWNPVKHRRKAKLLKMVEEFKFEIQAILNFIKLNFSDLEGA